MGVRFIFLLYSSLSTKEHHLVLKSEEIRNEINKWILKQKESDGVFDFASALAKNSQSMKDELHIGDGLHPNKEGGIVMANVVLQNRR